MRELRSAVVTGVLFLALVVPVARAATFTVINANDTGAGSLRQAILDANGNGNAPTVDFIQFAIPGTGVQTITFGFSGDNITEPVTIDATTQPGTTSLPLIELVAGTNPITAFRVSSTGVTIRGFAVNGFNTGISTAQITGGVTVVGNFIGTDATGVQSPGAGAQGTGVVIDRGSTGQVGGPNPGDGNVIASYGIGIDFPIGNGTVPGSTVVGNFIGVDRAQTTALGNGIGVRIRSLFVRVPVTGNVIAHSTSGSGVQISNSNRDPVLDNSFYANSPKGIDLGTTGNNLQPAPTLLTAATDGLMTRITGTQTIPPTEQIHVQLFTNPVAEQQGRTFVGEIAALGVPSFDVTFPVASTPGHFANATATRLSTDDTSEFSNDVEMAAAPLIAKSFVPASIIAGSTSTLRFTLTNLGATDITAVSFNDSYPPGLANSGSPAPATNCGGTPAFGATPGGTSFSASGLTVPAGSCDVTVQVTAPVGSYLNDMAPGDVLSSNGPSLSPTSATLNVVARLAAPIVTKAFTPAGIVAGESSTLTIKLINPNGTAITGVGFTDTYPAGLVNSTSPAPTTTCGGVATAPPGPAGNSLGLAGGTIPANGSCTVSATVTASAVGSFNNALLAGAVTSDNADPNDGVGSSATLGVSSVIDVPTLDGRWLALLGVLLAGGALLILRRR